MAQQMTVRQAFEIVDRQNFQDVHSFLSKQGVFRIELMDLEYKRFIALCAVHANKLNPMAISDVIDCFWHAHILFTREYVNMAKALDLQYIHHQPLRPSSANQDLLSHAYDRTLVLYEENFGEYNINYWPTFNQVCMGHMSLCTETMND